MKNQLIATALILAAQLTCASSSGAENPLPAGKAAPSSTKAAAADVASRPDRRCEEPPKCPLRLEVIDISPGPVITKENPGSLGIKLGLEGGCVLKIEGAYHLFTAEMVGDPWWKKMRLGHWTSLDRVNWTRSDTMMESSGDFTGIDLKANVWAPMPFYDEKAGVWNCYYVAYRAKPNDSTGWNVAYDGRIIRAVSQTPGHGGIGGPWKDVGIALEPAWEPWKQDRSQPWEGLQGTDSMSPPYQAGGKWLAFYGSAQTQSNRNPAFKKWSVGLAEAPAPTGPWRRCEQGNPMPFDRFPENPIVTPLPDGSYLMAFDAEAKEIKELDPGITGYACSPDGVRWSRSEKLRVPAASAVWWEGGARTPLGCIAETDGTYTIFFMAQRKDVRWQELGFVRVRVKSNL